jgi:predicted RNA binding protein YcfA (HicA-like mRNA interferase family)
LDAAQEFVQSLSVSKVRKAREKIMGGLSDKNVTFAEAVQVLEREGFVQDGGKGSHQVYRHKDGRKMVLPRHGKEIKPVYIRHIRELLT